MTERLRVAIATPLVPELVAMIAERVPGLDIDYRPELMAEPGPNWMRGHDRTPDDEEKYRAYVDGAQALFGVPDHSGKALARTVAANPELTWVHTIPAGGGQQVKAANLSREQLERIVFTTSAGVHAEPLAEFAVFGVLAGSKRLPVLLQNQREHFWEMKRMQMGLAPDSVVAIVGLGGIGKLTAHKLRAIGYRTVGVHRHAVDAEVERIYPVEQFADAAAASDAIVLALPGTAQTDKMLSREVLAAIKPGATVVNVGRGTTVDEDALVEALQDGRVGLAVLDVTYVEPLPAESPLWDLPNVIISPHTAAISEHEPRLIAELFAENARRFLDGEPMLNVVNTVEFY